MPDSYIEILEQNLGNPDLYSIDTNTIENVMRRVKSHQADLRAWLIAKSVPHKKVYGDFQNRPLSDSVLAKAYAIGARYINALIRDDKKPFPRRPQTSAALDFTDEDLTPLAKPFGTLLDQTISDPAPGPAIEIPNQVISGNADSIARAAAAAIAPRLEAAKAALIEQNADNLAALRHEFNSTQQSISAAIDRRWTEAEKHFAERTKSLVAETRATVVELAEKLLPRRLEIKTPTLNLTLAPDIRHKSFDQCLKWLLSGENVYAVGPAGTGKSHLGEQLATAINKRFLPIGQSLTKYDVSGFKGPTGEYFGTVARDAIENGGLLFVDEGDMWASTALGFLNNPLANGWCAFPDKMVKVHEHFQCMICANTFGRGATQDYIGRNPLDAASLDRFAYVIIDYDEDMERLIYGSGPWLQYTHRVRAAVNQLKMRHVISQRAIKRAINGAAAGLSVDEICFSSFWRGLDPDSINKIKQIAGNLPQSVENSNIGLDLMAAED